MKNFLWMVTLLGVLPRAAPAQDVEWVDIRFHRVYLNNGYFIDGTLVKQTPAGVTLKLKAGEMTIKMDMIEKVEYMKIRSINEKPKTEGLRRTPPPPRTQSNVNPPLPENPPPRLDVSANRASRLRRPEELFTPNPATKKKVDDILAEMDKANVEQKDQVSRRLLEVGPETAPYLASLLEQTNAEQGPFLIQTLHQLKDPQAIPVLTKLLQSVNPSIRGQVGSIIAETQPSGALALIQPLLKDEDSAVRAATVTTLQSLGDADSISAIARLCGDPDREVRTRAIGAVFDLSRKNPSSDDASSIFERALGETSGRARDDLLLAVGRSGNPRLWTTVTSYLSDNEPSTRAAAATALSNLGAPEANSAVVARISQEQESVPKVALAAAAQKLGLKEAVPSLIYWLGDSDPNVPAAAQRALQALTGTNYGTDRAGWEAWWEKNKPKG
jgi:HEAT repeat protein